MENDEKKSDGNNQVTRWKDQILWDGNNEAVSVEIQVKLSALQCRTLHFTRKTKQAKQKQSCGEKGTRTRARTRTRRRRIKRGRWGRGEDVARRWKWGHGTQTRYNNSSFATLVIENNGACCRCCCRCCCCCCCCCCCSSSSSHLPAVPRRPLGPNGVVEQNVSDQRQTLYGNQLIVKAAPKRWKWPAALSLSLSLGRRL